MSFSSTFGRTIDFSPYWCAYHPVLIGTLRSQIKEGGGLVGLAWEQFPQNQSSRIKAGCVQRFAVTCSEELQGGSPGIHCINLPCPKLTPICFKALLIRMLKSLASAFSWGCEDVQWSQHHGVKDTCETETTSGVPMNRSKKNNISALSPWFPHVTLVLYTVMSPW